MSDKKNVSVSSLQKGSYVIIDDDACKVTDVKISRPGKHGHAKVNLTAVTLIEGKKKNVILPGHDIVEVPIIGKKTAQVLSVSGNMANVMDSESFETFDLEIPEELEGSVTEGSSVLYWDILGKAVMKQVKSD
jgi:translation initiation factor 5A